MKGLDLRRGDWRYRALCFVSSFLLFEIELLIARAVSPDFGSSAAVWTTCLVFFQVVLVLGYFLGERASTLISRGTYRWAHLIVILLAATCFPFRIVRPSGPPALAVLVALAGS